jgi:hypothetical protein
MNRLRSTAQRLVPAVVAAVALLLVSGIAAAQDTPPSIPHPLEGRDACLGCHEAGLAGAPQVPADHAGRTNEICRGCHQPATATSVAPTATSEPTGGPPVIPHPLEGRQECLSCHQEGMGGAPKVPEDHVGRTSDVCQGCHQPLQPTEAPPVPAQTGAIPTPIAYPQAVAGVNTCAACHAKLGGTHADITAQSQRSIHAERNVTCVNCHGGDPTATTKEAAMAPAAGFIGVPAKKDIPALCASCHANVDLMRQFNLPTDQFAKYNESVHGKLLAEGDTNVTTCFDCHGGHQILKPNDPASSVYPANVPALCAKCHSDKDLMAPYGIPTDQLDLYRQSVHGHALLDKQDFRAPTCATCHGTHGATPPGVAEVANVCGNCHGATQDHYQKSAHAQGGDSAPRCVTCHGQHAVNPPTDAALVSAEPQHCGTCHAPDSAEGKVAQAMYDAFDSTTRAYDDAEQSIKSAQQLGMLVTQQEGELQKANTGIITARAAQHTLDGDAVVKTLEEARMTADGAKAGAEAAIAQSILRRRAMVIAVAAIALTIVALYLLKRQLDRRLADRSRP